MNYSTDTIIAARAGVYHDLQIADRGIHALITKERSGTPLVSDQFLLELQSEANRAFHFPPSDRSITPMQEHAAALLGLLETRQDPMACDGEVGRRPSSKHLGPGDFYAAGQLPRRPPR